ncbi:MAG: hypothetical protein ACLGSD_18795 [Acidobacteriota bacterium]
MSNTSAIQPSQAVERCRAAYQNAYKDSLAAGNSNSSAKDAAHDAYLQAMPHLDTRDDIRSFIACVTHGILHDIFWRRNGKELLVAARIAAAALPRESSSAGRPAGRPAVLPTA